MAIVDPATLTDAELRIRAEKRFARAINNRIDESVTKLEKVKKLRPKVLFTQERARAACYDLNRDVSLKIRARIWRGVKLKMFIPESIEVEDAA